MKRFSLGMVVFLLALALSITPTVNASGGGPKFEQPPAPNHKAEAKAFPVKQEIKKRNTGVLYKYFTDAAAEFNVPVELLLAIGYAESRWQDHKGKPSQLNGYGIMHLADHPDDDSLKRAAELLKLPEKRLKNDIKHNIRGAAAVLAQLAKEENEKGIPEDLGEWYTTVAKYSGMRSPMMKREYADEVYRIINEGVHRVIDGKDVYIDPVSVEPNRREYENVSNFSLMATPDYPGARWVPAHSGNYTAANRPHDGNKINYVIIHTTQGSYAGAISWFQNPASKVSAHYVIRSRDGEITQMVRHKDIGWHAGNWEYNKRSIGVEHAGYVSDPAWYTDSMYRASAALTRWICDTYGIPKNRNHILAHSEVPGATHTDPGPHWDWNYYMSLVNQSSSTTITVDNSTPGRFQASGNWGGSTWSSQKYGSDYRFANPQSVSDAAWYKVNIPTRGMYDVYAWWPANSGYNNRTPYVISTTTGNKTVHVDQRYNGGKWNHLGTFELAAGDNWIIGVSRWTSGTGYVIADAIRVVKR